MRDWNNQVEVEIFFLSSFQITQNLKPQKNRSKKSAYALHEQSIKTHFTLRWYDESDVWLCDVLAWHIRRLCHTYLCFLSLSSAATFFEHLFEKDLREILARHMQSIWSIYERTRKMRMIWSEKKNWARPDIRLAYAEHRVEIVSKFFVNYKVQLDVKKKFWSRLDYFNSSWTELIIIALIALQKVELKLAQTSWFSLTIILKVNNWIVKAFQSHVI